mgnify:CR=1 FL=1
MPLETKPTWRAKLPRKWDSSSTWTWEIDDEGRHAVIAWLTLDDDERQAFGVIEMPLAKKENNAKD